MSDFSSTPSSDARHPVARITGQHGYFIDGDSVHLNADIEWSDRALASSGASAWALQLWARPAFSAANADSIKVAELPLPRGVDGQLLPERVEGWGFALAPAGTEAYTMVLELRAGDGQRFDTVHDQVAYARNERFVQPRLSGTGGYRFNGEQLRLEVDRVENPRARDNLSGSLSFELWAAEEPYRGGEVRGHRVGGAALGRLSGQAHWSPVGVDVAAQALPAGRWFLSLILREWSAAGWVTRDYIGFSAPHRVEGLAIESKTEVAVAAVAAVVAVPAAVSDSVPDSKADSVEPVVNSVSDSVPDSISKPSDSSLNNVDDSAAATLEIPARVTSAIAAAAAAMKDAPVATATHAAIPAAASAVVAKAKQAAAPVAVAVGAPKAKASAAAKPKSASAATSGVSINEASPAELATVKGLPKAVAQAIVAGRPHASIDALLDVKGMGPKLLEKLRAGLRL